MNSDLKYAKGLSTEVLLILADSREICGRFFLADHARNHYGEETLLDLLNKSTNVFVPFGQCEDEKVLLIKKSQILGLKPRYANTENWPQTNECQESCWPPAKIDFPDLVLEGWAYTGDMKPDRRRLADLLNHSQEFFAFKTNDGPWIINKNLMNYLEPMPREMQD